MKKTTTTTKTPAKKQATRKPAAPAPAVPKAGPRKPRKPKLKVADTSDEHKKVSAQAESPVLQEKIAKAKAKAAEVTKVTPKPTPVIPEAAQLTKDQLRILNRDLPDGSMNLLKHWIDVNGVMGSDAVDLTDLLPSPKSTIKKDMVHLAELKQRLLVRTAKDGQIEWVYLTSLGEQLKAYLEELANPAPLVIDGLKDHVEATVPARKPAATPTAKPAASPRVAAPKIDRAKVRYEAVAWVMTKVKPDSWSKAQYNPLLKDLEVKYAPLYAKLKTPEKRHAYSTGIVDFCLAACRKVGQKP